MNPVIVFYIMFLLGFVGLFIRLVILRTRNKSAGRYRIVFYQSLYNSEAKWYYIEHKPRKYIDKWNTVYGIHKRSNSRYTGESLKFNTEQEAVAYITNVLIPEETNPLIEKKEETIISYHP